MRKTVSIGLVGLMVYNILGYYFAYLILINEAKQDVKNSGPSEELIEKLVTIKLPYSKGEIKDKDFKLIEEDEFSYRGEMYDVVHSQVKGAYIYFYCISDTKEDNIDSALISHLENQNNLPSQHKKEIPVLKNILKKYLPIDDFVPIIVPDYNIKRFSSYYFAIITSDSDVSTPPPKFI